MKKLTLKKTKITVLDNTKFIMGGTGHNNNGGTDGTITYEDDGNGCKNTSIDY